LIGNDLVRMTRFLFAVRDAELWHRARHVSRRKNVVVQLVAYRILAVQHRLPFPARAAAALASASLLRRTPQRNLAYGRLSPLESGGDVCVACFPTDAGPLARAGSRRTAS